MAYNDMDNTNTQHAIRRLKIAIVVILVALTIYLFIALFSFNINDKISNNISSGTIIKNYAGPIGAYIANFILSIFGIIGFSIPFTLIHFIRILLIKKQKINLIMIIVQTVGIIFFILSSCTIFELYLSFINDWMPKRSGGILGYKIANICIKYFGNIGGLFVILVYLLIGITLYYGTMWLNLSINIVSIFIKSINFLRKPKKKYQKIPNCNNFKYNPSLINLQQKGNTPLKIITKKTNIQSSKINNLNKVDLPSIDLLIKPEIKKVEIYKTQRHKTSSLIEETLNDFNITAKVVDAYSGPVITRYEIDLEKGTKVSKLINITQDLARALSTIAIRVVPVIPGKPYVGLEIPNQQIQMVRIKEVLYTKKFLKSSAATLMGIGVDISGNPILVELIKMPHLLVAGTTGSGKSVGINSMIISMLYKNTPDEIKFIMIDPKMLELSIYEGIPHLLTPVITDMTEAANSLQWCVKEMERRYYIMSEVGVRNIELLNDKIEKNKKAGKPIKDSIFIKMNQKNHNEIPNLKKIPYIIVIVDEFADLIMVVGKKVEKLIVRLTQKARAAGIHIILATQRPSVDVVTGLIKANIPARMSFQVSSKIDSRTILDQQGAEQLLGHGDMLYIKPGFSTPIRIHGAFIDDNEVHKVVKSWKKYGEPKYIKDIIESNGEDINISSNMKKNPLSKE